MLWNCYSTCLSHSSLRTWWDQALKPQHEDTYDVFEGVPSHLVLGNKHSRTWWEFTLLPSFTIPVKSELVHEQQCSFVCYIVFFLSIILCAKWKKNIHALIKISILFRNNFLWIKNFFTNLCPHQNVNFKFWFPVSKEHNCGKLSSNIKRKDSFKIRIVLAFQKCPKM